MTASLILAPARLTFSCKRQLLTLLGAWRANAEILQFAPFVFSAVVQMWAVNAEAAQGVGMEKMKQSLLLPPFSETSYPAS